MSSSLRLQSYPCYMDGGDKQIMGNWNLSSNIGLVTLTKQDIMCILQFFPLNYKISSTKVFCTNSTAGSFCTYPIFMYQMGSFDICYLHNAALQWKTFRCANTDLFPDKMKTKLVTFFSFSVQVVCVFCKPLWGNLLVTRETNSVLFTLQWKVLQWPINFHSMYTAQQVLENIPFSHLLLTWVKIPFDCIAIATRIKIGFQEAIFSTKSCS